MKGVMKMMHQALYQHNINKTMLHKIDFFCKKLKPDLDIDWETPLAHLIPRTPLFAMVIGNSSLDGAGGFSIALRFCWHLRSSDKVIQRTLHFK
jgi:hypothetical protein